MLAVPELSAKVFTVDLGEGLADRIKNSPTVGPLLEQNGGGCRRHGLFISQS